jgi:hypothetical protein
MCSLAIYMVSLLLIMIVAAAAVAAVAAAELSYLKQSILGQRQQ